MLDIIILIGVLLVLPQVLWLALILLGLLTPVRKTSQLAKAYKFLFVVPAHNEEKSIKSTIRSLQKVDYSRDRYDIVVIADNCSDQTAEVARAAGARVWERNSRKKSKGYALEEAFPRFMEQTSADAFVVVDADTKVHPEVLLEFAGDISEGKDWIQGYYSGLNSQTSWRTKLMQWGFAIFNGTYLQGLQGLGISIPLRGNGMCFTRRGLQRQPWSAHGLAEDMEFGWKLRLAGEKVYYNRNAQVYGEFVSRNGAAAKSQRQRWEQGREAVRQTVKWQLSSLKWYKHILARLELGFKPLAYTVLHLASLFAVAFYFYTLGFTNQLSIASLMFGMGGILVAYVLSPFVFGYLKVDTLYAVIHVPRYLAWKILLKLKGKKATEWQRTGRESESSESGFTLGGIRFAAVTLKEATSKTVSLAGEAKVQWVITPNSDHLLRSQQNSRFKAITQQASLIVPDGMPIVWASKLLGRPLPERVTGADLLPSICEKAAEAGIKVCFFGGDRGEAKLAVKRSTKNFPGLKASGIYPPYGFDKDEHLNEQLIAQIAESGAQIVFVGVGSPKQEAWIYQNRKRLPHGVYLGVGMAIALAAGKKKRAPAVMQKLGLEWVYRLMQEPGRLSRRYFSNLEIVRLVFSEYKNRR